MPKRDALVDIVEQAIAGANENGVVRVSESALSSLLYRFRSVAAQADAWREAAKRYGCTDTYPGPVELQRKLYGDAG